MALTQEQFKRIMGLNSPEPITGAVATGLNYLKQPLDKYAINQNVPVVGGMSAADILGLTGAQGVIQDFSKGKNITGDMRLFDVMGLAPTVAPALNISSKAAKALGTEALRQIETGTGIIGKNVIDPRMYVYLQDTPKNRNPLVGTRFENKPQGNLVPEIPLKIEDLKGASINVVPYDLTNADRLITSVSDEVLDKPVYTMGGGDFSRLAPNYNANIAGASNREIAKRVVKRNETTRRENLAQGGTGEVLGTPILMAKNSEWFTTYPTDVGKQFILRGDTKDIYDFNKSMREASVVGKPKVRPFANFKGIETPEGQLQLLTGEGFGKGGTAGEFRKAFMQKMSLKQNQQRFGYNFEDIINSTLEPEIMNLPKGFAGRNIVRTDEGAGLSPSEFGSKIPAYDTDIAGKYIGKLQPTPVEFLMPKVYNRLFEFFANKYPNKHPLAIRNMAIGAMEKRKENIGELIDQQVIDSYYNYHEGLLGK